MEKNSSVIWLVFLKVILSSKMFCYIVKSPATKRTWSNWIRGALNILNGFVCWDLLNMHLFFYGQEKKQNQCPMFGAPTAFLNDLLHEDTFSMNIEKLRILSKVGDRFQYSSTTKNVNAWKWILNGWVWAKIIKGLK